MVQALLPTSATPWEGALADAMPVSAEAASAINAMRRVKLTSPRSSMLPFLVWEYGLGELTPYVPNLYQLIDEGIRWQRLRGTVSAVAIGLAWIGYDATVEPAWHGRRWWNSFQLRFDELPGQDVPDLERIEGIASLSVPKRSHLRRGVHRYDVGPLRPNHARWNRAMWGFESGIRIQGGGALWSFGRSREAEHLLTRAEGEAIGNWIEPTEGAGLPWVTMNFPWVSASFPWAAGGETQRQSALARWFVGRELWVRFTDIEGATIGYRRCRAVHQVRTGFSGVYSIGEEIYVPAADGAQLYVEAMTQFGDADGVQCTSVALIVGGSRAAGVKPGTLWLEPDELIGGEAIAVRPVELALRRTVREQIKFLLRFNNPSDESFRITASPVETAILGQVYGFKATALQGVPPYGFSLVGEWPAGLSVDTATGQVSGIPTEIGTFSNLTIQAEDSSMASVQLAAFDLVVSPPALQISGVPVLVAQQGVAYEGFTVSATGGVPPYSYSVASGALPAGITLDPDTGEVAGTPTESGAFNDIVIQVTDSA